MPIYEYQCTACGHQLEAFQKFSEEPLKDCPECHKPQLNKLISAAGFQLKGTGWYATDYKSKSQPTISATEKSDGKEAKPADSQSSDTKAAAAKPADTPSKESSNKSSKAE